MKFVLSALLLCFSAVVLNAQDLSYQLSMPDPHTHYFEVDMTVKNYKTESFIVKMPVWAPGSYLIREFGKSVEAVKAVDGNGKEIAVQKMTKNTWKVLSKKAKKVTVSYKVYAFELSVRTSYIDESHGYVNGTSIFMFLEDHMNKGGELTVKPYKTWKQINTGLPILNGNKWTRSFSNYDVLVDSPIEIGNQEIFEFEAAGVNHIVAMYGQGNYDIDMLKSDMARVIESSTNVFNTNPNKEYTFIIHNLTTGSGGLEHLNSTTLQVNRWTYAGPKYKNFLSLVAHEYFHLWNVKRIRPIELGPFNYEKENYTSLLWIMEGFTSYYDELLLLRSDFYNRDLYLNKLVSTITRVENQPGNKVLSVAQSSLDAWVKLYRPNENSYNTTISYYSKGQLVAAMLDLKIIHATSGEKSLDDVMVYLYQEYYVKQKRGFTPAEAKKALEKIAGESLDQFFEDHINGTKTIDYNKYLSYVGLEINDIKAKLKKPSLGVRTSGDDGRVVISSVTRNTTAYESGLSAKDEIIAIDENRVSKKNLSQLIGLYNVGDDVDITIARDNLIMTINVVLKADPSLDYKMSMLPSPTADQRRALEKWLVKK